MFDNIPMLLKPRLNLFGCVYGRIIILEYGSVWQQYAGHSKNFIVEDVEIFICSDPALDGNNRTSRIPRYRRLNHHGTAPVLDCGKQAVRIVGIFWGSPHINPAVCREQCKRWFIGLYYIPPIINCPRFMIMALYFFRSLALASVIRGFESAALPWMLALWSSRRTVLVETVLLRCELSSAVTFAAVVLCCLATILFNVRQSLSVNFSLRPLFLFAGGPLPCLCKLSSPWILSLVKR